MLVLREMTPKEKAKYEVWLRQENIRYHLQSLCKELGYKIPVPAKKRKR